MRYTLTHPMVITSRLTPGLYVGDGMVSVAVSGFENADRARITYIIDFPGGSHRSVGSAPWRGDQNSTIRKAAATALSFLSAEVEHYQAAAREGRTEPADGWLFNRQVAEWAHDNATAIEAAALELEGGQE